MSELYRRGLKEITRIDPERGAELVRELKKISPDFAEYFVEFAFGTIYARDVLDPKTKELIAIASLAAIGHCQNHLRTHISAAFRAGCTKEEIVEVIIQSAVYVGFPSALSALKLVKDFFDKRRKP